MRPTRQAIYLFGAGIPVALLVALLDVRLWPIALGYLGISVVLTGLDGILAPPASRVTTRVEPPAVLFIGETDRLAVALETGGWRRAVSLEIACDVNDLLQTPPEATVTVAPGETAQAEIGLVPRRRGQGRIERIWLRWRGPLGLMSRFDIRTVDAGIPIVPNVRAVGRSAIKLNLRDALYGSKAQKQQGEGSAFESLRDYVPGLDHRAIDWKHSARHRALVCKEFRAERNHQIVIAFDTGHLMVEPLDGIPKLDRAVNAGLMLAYVSLRAGDRVGLFGFDSQVRRYFEPVGNMLNYWRFQQASAALAYREEETNFTLGLADLAGRLNRRSLIVVLTDFVDTVTAELMIESLGRMAARHLVLFVSLRDPLLAATIEAEPDSLDGMARAVIADDFARDRLVVFERLRRLGIQCLDAHYAHVDTDLVNRYLAIKREERI